MPSFSPSCEVVFRYETCRFGFVRSPVPKCEGPGAPIFVVGRQLLERFHSTCSRFRLSFKVAFTSTPQTKTCLWGPRR